MTFGRDRTSFKWRQLGAIAMTVAFKTCRVVARVFGDSQCSRFQSSQFGVVAGLATVPTIREVTLALCPNQRSRNRRIAALRLWSKSTKVSAGHNLLRSSSRVTTSPGCSSKVTRI